MKKCFRDHQVRTTADPVLGLRWSKAPSSIGKISSAGILRLRATTAVSRDRYVRRSAQDDGFAGSWRWNKPALIGRSSSVTFPASIQRLPFSASAMRYDLIHQHLKRIHLAEDRKSTRLN